MKPLFEDASETGKLRYETCDSDIGFVDEIHGFSYVIQTDFNVNSTTNATPTCSGCNYIYVKGLFGGFKRPICVGF